MNVPDGSILKYLRTCYVDTAPVAHILAWLTTSPNPGQSLSTDTVSAISSGGVGFGMSVSEEVDDHPTDSSQRYSLLYGWGVKDNINMTCGVRVAYYAPSIFGAALPMIQKD